MPKPASSATTSAPAPSMSGFSSMSEPRNEGSSTGLPVGRTPARAALAARGALAAATAVGRVFDGAGVEAAGGGIGAAAVVADTAGAGVGVAGAGGAPVPG